MRYLKIELAYDGTQYSGWQHQSRQPNVRTIQGELEKTLEKITGTSISVLGSGRTDAGVHALYQVATFSGSKDILNLPVETYTRAMNAFLPPDIRIWRTTETNADFHPIHDVVRKRYRYLISDKKPFFPFFNRYVWFSTKELNLDRMKKAASCLVGTHDFRAFQTEGSPRKTTVRTIFDVSIENAVPAMPWLFSVPQTSADLSPFPTSNLIVLEVEADGFLYNMVRTIAGTLYLFGRGHKGFENPNTMKTILESGNRQMAGPTAPPHALYMIKVVYPELNPVHSITRISNND